MAEPQDVNRTDHLDTTSGSSQVIVSSHLNLRQIMLRVAERARHLTRADYAAFSTFDDQGRLELFVHAGMDASLTARLGEAPVGRGLLGELARHERVIRLDDARRHPSYTGWPAGHPEMAAFLGVPIRAGETTIGALYMTRTAGSPPFTREDELAATVLAYQTAASLANAIPPRSHERLDLLVANTPDLICTVGTDGYFKQVNPAFMHVLGYSEPELLARPLIGFVHPEDREATLVEFALLTTDDDIMLFENRLLCEDGGYRWLSWTAVPDLQVDLVLAIARDVTDARTVQEGLVTAREDADRANLAKSEFLSGMSHELRTPLNVILGFTQIVQMDEEFAERHGESLGHILEAGRQLLDLIDEVLDIARIEAGRLSLSIEPVAVRDLANGVIELLRPSAVERNVSLDSGAIPDTVYVLADRNRLWQVLINLVNNAIKYNVDGGSVQITAERDGERVRIRVSDTRPGIAADHLGRLFEPFDRLDSEHLGLPGTGLGLPLSKGLAEAMHGTIHVESVPREGSSFWVDLPATTPVDVAGTTPARVRRPSHRNLSGRTVLYIEDNFENLKVVEELLDIVGGVTVLSAMQGSIGIDFAIAHRPDLIVLDLHLPDMDGEAVLLRLRAQEETGTIPVVVASADATHRSIKRLLDSGAAAYLTKPLDLRELLGTLDRLLSPAAGDASDRDG